MHMYDVLSLVLIYSALSSTLTYIHMHVLLEYAFLCILLQPDIIIIFFMIRVRPSVCLFAASVALFQSKPSILILRAVSKLMIDHCECILISDMMISTGSRSRDPCFPRIIGFVSSARQQRLNRYLRRSFVFGKS